MVKESAKSLVFTLKMNGQNNKKLSSTTKREHYIKLNIRENVFTTKSSDTNIGTECIWNCDKLFLLDKYACLSTACNHCNGDSSFPAEVKTKFRCGKRSSMMVSHHIWSLDVVPDTVFIENRVVENMPREWLCMFNRTKTTPLYCHKECIKFMASIKWKEYFEPWFEYVSRTWWELAK